MLPTIGARAKAFQVKILRGGLETDEFRPTDPPLWMCGDNIIRVFPSILIVSYVRPDADVW